MKAKFVLALALCFAAVTLLAPATAKAEFGEDGSVAKPLARKLKAEGETVEDAGTELDQDPSVGAMRDLKSGKSYHGKHGPYYYYYHDGYYDQKHGYYVFTKDHGKEYNYYYDDQYYHLYYGDYKCFYGKYYCYYMYYAHKW